MTSGITFTAVAYDRAGAAAATGIGETTLDDARKRGDLVAHFVGSKPVFRAVELDAWIASLPTEKRGRS